MIALLTGAVGFGMTALILWLVRRDRLHVQHATAWVVVGIAFAFLGFVPGIVDWIALKLGVGYPPVIGLTAGIVLLVIKVLMMDIDRSRNTVRVDRLVQRIAILEAELCELSTKSQSDIPEEERSPE